MYNKMKSVLLVSVFFSLVGCVTEERLSHSGQPNQGVVSNLLQMPVIGVDSEKLQDRQLRLTANTDAQIDLVILDGVTGIDDVSCYDFDHIDIDLVGSELKARAFAAPVDRACAAVIWNRTVSCEIEGLNAGDYTLVLETLGHGENGGEGPETVRFPVTVR